MRLQVLVSPDAIAVFQYDCVHIPTEGQGDALVRVIDSYPCVFPELLRCSVDYCDKAMPTIVYEVADEVESSVAKGVYFVQLGMYHFYLVLSFIFATLNFSPLRVHRGGVYPRPCRVLLGVPSFVSYFMRYLSAKARHFGFVVGITLTVFAS